MLSEISQVVKNKHHLISPLSGTYSTKQTSRQNITTDIEIKNKGTVTRGEVGGDNGEKGEGFSGTTIKDTWTKRRRGGIRQGREVGMVGVEGKRWEGKQTTVLEQQ